jgi:hypothetical protein
MVRKLRVGTFWRYRAPGPLGIRHRHRNCRDGDMGAGGAIRPRFGGVVSRCQLLRTGGGFAVGIRICRRVPAPRLILNVSINTRTEPKELTILNARPTRRAMCALPARSFGRVAFRAAAKGLLCARGEMESGPGRVGESTARPRSFYRSPNGPDSADSTRCRSRGHWARLRTTLTQHRLTSPRMLPRAPALPISASPSGGVDALVPERPQWRSPSHGVLRRTLRP